MLTCFQFNSRSQSQLQLEKQLEKMMSVPGLPAVDTDNVALLHTAFGQYKTMW